MKKSIRDAAAALGSRGGRAGTGAAKRRGDSEYYRRLVARRKDRKRKDSGIRHRHLEHQDYTLAAIDDIIDNGGRLDWEQLREALLREPEIREKILRVCSARIHEPSAQRHHFWWHYARNSSSSS